LVITRGIPELFPEKEIEATRAELRSAHSILGVAGCEFLDFPAPRLDSVPQHEVSDAIRECVRHIRPGLVFVPHRGDIHHEHRIVFDAAMVALRPHPGETVGRILAYETLSETEWGGPFPDTAFLPNVFVDIAPQLERKVAAMQAYQSQLYESPHARSLEAIRSLALTRGHSVGLKAAEAFSLIREVLTGLALTGVAERQAMPDG
jgi:LmbE family N-acetylglucosaminyl deacetylase